jgi:hypothetical protein
MSRLQCGQGVYRRPQGPPAQAMTAAAPPARPHGVAAEPANSVGYRSCPCNNAARLEGELKSRQQQLVEETTRNTRAKVSWPVVARLASPCRRLH